MADDFTNDAEAQGGQTPGNAEDDFEEICSDEVDRVVDALESLAATVDSENIRFYLEEATLKIYLLIYGDDDDVQGEAA